MLHFCRKFSSSVTPEQTLFIHYNITQDNYPQVTTYVNKQLSRLRFILSLDIINYHDINILVFYNEQDLNFRINVYSDNNQTTLQFLHQNIRNMVIMTSNFNIRDSNQDPNFHHYFIYTDDLITIADSLGLELSSPLIQVLQDMPKTCKTLTLFQTLFFYLLTMLGLINTHFIPKYKNYQIMSCSLLK